MNAAVALSDLLAEEPDTVETDASNTTTDKNVENTATKLVTLDKLMNIFRQVSIERQETTQEHIDPSNDMDRIYNDVSGTPSVIQRLLQKEEVKGAAATGKSKATEMDVKCYVPIEITFSLIGVCLSALRKRNKASEKKKIVVKPIGMLTLGANTEYELSNYARLISSTVYFSQEAASNIWDCLRNASGPDGRREDKVLCDADADFCFNLEVKRHYAVSIINN